MNGENVADESDETDAVPLRRVSMTVTGYLTGHLGGWYDLQDRPDGGQQYSIPEFAVDEHSLTDLPPEQLTRDDWSEITGTLVARLGKDVGGQLAAQWMGIALAVQQARSESFRRRPAKTIEQLAAEQGVKPIESIDDLAGPGDIPEAEMDAFLAAIHERSDPQRDEVERRLRVATCTLRRARRLAVHWSGADGAYAETWHQASADLHAALDGPDDEPGDPDSAQRIREFEDLLASLWLHIGRHEVKQLTTEQKNLLADSVDAANARLAEADPAYGEPPRVERWWDE